MGFFGIDGWYFFDGVDVLFEDGIIFDVCEEDVGIFCCGGDCVVDEAVVSGEVVCDDECVLRCGEWGGDGLWSWCD